MALYPEETLYLYCTGKLTIPGVDSATALAQHLFQAPESPPFSMNMFILYKHLRSNSYIVRRESAQPLIEVLKKEGYEVPTKKAKLEEPASSERNDLFKVYKTIKDYQDSKVDFLVALQETGSISHDVLKFCALHNLKLAIVKEAKVVLLHIGSV